MIPKLSTNILSLLFEELEEEISTLYSCILVNRDWCQEAIRFLWKNPWKSFIDKYKDKRYKILFECFLMMMSKESKEFLDSNGIKIENLISTKKNYSLQTTLFNYTSFCKVINLNIINNMINYNINNIKDKNLKFEFSIKDHYQKYLINQEILKLLISNTSKLSILILSCEFPQPIATFPNSFISLSQLNELHCYGPINEVIFYGLSQLCRNIEKLVIEGYDQKKNRKNRGLRLLIEQQTNLKRVKFSNYYDDYRYISQISYSELGKALAAKSSSIIELDFDYFNPILLRFLNKFQDNLTIFKFNISCKIIELSTIKEYEEYLKDISFTNLQQLVIYYYCCHFEIIQKVIEKTNRGIKKINIGIYDKCNEDEKDDKLIPIITKHCPKLELLSALVDNLDEIKELIMECQNLRGLVIRTNELKDIEFFKVLYNDSTNKFRKLQLSNGWTISERALNELFENWKQQKRNSLDFYIPFHIYEDKYENIFKKYQELGVIRNFYKFTDEDANFLDSWG
ncbi:hypothetical protein C1645_822105 [Glomus cerebriforme]|uniref:F-box domain-containing protein n=1 Tax=Glomus cerebriforme TaxID=658196 RepID=A0A397T8U9_9GLOM|nr:hypothetical protein C1645_822105 [Glomus cerebriforme]